MTTFLFPRIIQRLCDKVSVPEIPGIDERIEAMEVAQNQMMKDWTYVDLSRRPRVLTIMPLAQSEGPLVPTKHIDTQGGDIAVSMEFEMGEQIEVLELSIQGEGTQQHLHQLRLVLQSLWVYLQFPLAHLLQLLYQVWFQFHMSFCKSWQTVRASPTLSYRIWRLKCRRCMDRFNNGF